MGSKKDKFKRRLKRKIRALIISFLSKAGLAHLVYVSYWYSVNHPNKHTDKPDHYLTARPNPGAGIGHQIANWIAGKWFAGVFNVRFADSHFPESKWDNFLGFCEGEESARHLVKRRNYKKVILPLFNEDKPKDMEMIRRIIASYGDQKVVFYLEQDQFYRDQFGVMDEIRSKFNNSLHRTTDDLIYQPDTFNIAVHIRRGDIDVPVSKQNANLNMRWQKSGYFEQVLNQVLEMIPSGKKYKIYIFSQGSEDDFIQFKKYENVQLNLKMNDLRTFLHFVRADLLITSKSSFSYKPALLSSGIRICPANFWHSYPDSPEWILADEKGVFDKEKLIQQFKKLK